jgi:hypothetical protein
MLAYRLSGVSVDTSVCIAAHDSACLERLLQVCAGASMAWWHPSGAVFQLVRLSGHLQRQGGVVKRAQAGQEVKTLEHDAHAVAPQIG